MSRFLFVTMPATGHVNPKVPIARELIARGHEVHWYTGSHFREQILATGAVHHPIRSAEDFGGQSLAQAFPELHGLTGLTMVRAAFQRVFIDNAPGMLEDCETILADYPADVILSETLCLAPRWINERGGPPWATLGETMLGLYSRATAPVGPGLPPLPGIRGRVRNSTMNAVHRRVLFAGVTRHYEQARARVGLGRLGRSFIDTFPSPYLYLQATVPSFEYPRPDLPLQLHFIGPLLPEPAAPDEPNLLPWPDDGRPITLVTQGTVATDPRELLLPSIQALRGDESRVLLTTGGPTAPLLDALDGPPDESLHIVPFVSYPRVLERVELLITNGGYGTVQLALAHGIPIIVAGATEDKPEVAARIAWSGVGIRLRGQSPPPSAIAAAVGEIRRDPRYRRRAAAIAAEMAAYDAGSAAAELLERLAESKQPILRAQRYAPVGLASRGIT